MSSRGIAGILRGQFPAAATSVAASDTAGTAAPISVIPPGFFSKEEQGFIEAIIQKYHLSLRLSLLELLSFDCFQHLKQYADIVKLYSITACQEYENLQELIKIFPRYFLRIFARFYLSSIKGPIQEPTLSKFSISASDFLKSLQGIVITCKESRQKAKLSTSQMQPTARRLAERAFKNNLEAMGIHITQFESLQNILSKLFESPLCTKILTDQPLRYLFPGICFASTKVIPASTSISKIQAVKDISDYLGFLERSRMGESKMPFGGVGISCLSQLLEVLQTDQPLSTEFIQQWNMAVRAHGNTLLDLTSILFEDYYEAEEGRLSHKQWAEKRKIPILGEWNAKGFVETLHVQCAVAMLISSWAEDIIHMVESHLCCPFLPAEYISQEMFMKSVSFKLLGLMEDVVQSDGENKKASRGISKDFSTLALGLSDQIHQIRKPFHDILFPSFIKQWDILASAEAIPFLNVARVCRDLLNQIPNIDEFCVKLMEVQKTFESELKVFIEAASPEVLKQNKDKWIHQLKKTYIQEMGRLFVLITFFKDLEYYMKQAPLRAQWDFRIPFELRKMFNFIPKIPSLFDREEPCKSSLASSDAAEEFSAPIAELIKPRVDSTPVEKIAPKVASPKIPSKEEELILRLKSAEKRREFVSILEQLGFDFSRYGKGTHEIWTKEGAGTVVLPFHNGRTPLKAGTQHAIIKQVEAAVNKDSK
jgi:predicted RNA binding protein YcfA (HicA-like mRNA interferase family)